MDIKYLSSVTVLFLALGGLVIAAEDRYQNEKDALAMNERIEQLILQNNADFKAASRQKDIDNLQEEIDYLSDKQSDGETSRSDDKRLERVKRRLNVLIRGQ